MTSQPGQLKKHLKPRISLVKISVEQNHFPSPEAVRQEIADQGMHLCEMKFPAVDNQSHWHRFSTLIYILDGELHIKDSARAEVLVAGPGSRVSVPERVLHSERSDGYTILAGMTVDPASLGGDVDLHPDLLDDD